MSSFNKMPVPQPAEPRQQQTPKPRLMVMLTKETQDETQDAITQVGSGAGNMGSLVRLRCRRRPDRGRAVRLQHAPTLRLRLLCCRGLQLRLRLLCCRGGWTLAHGLEIERE